MHPRSKTPRKNRKLQPWKLAKTNRIYDRRQAVALYGISENTLTNWVKEGLAVVYDGKVQLFRGDRLNEFHRNRASARRHPCEGPNLYCVRCRAPRPPLGMTCHLRDEEGELFKVLSWTCSDPGCLGVNSTFIYSRGMARLTEAGVTLIFSDVNGDS
jgi:hypothetical protein